MSPANDDEYILGTDDVELLRLREQHEIWLDHARALWARAKLDGLETLLDLGCGPGYTSLDLAAFAGPQARVLALDESERFVGALRAHLDREPGPNVEPMVSRIEEIDLAPESVDGAYARWLFSWLDDPGGALANVARVLRPGAPLALQEYLDWGTFTLLPPQPEHGAAVRAALASWNDVQIDVAAQLPAHAIRAGLEVEHFEAIARVGAPGSPVWRWLEGFYSSYLPRLAARGLITDPEVAAALGAWRRHAALPGARVLAPTVASVILRKPK